MNKEKQRSEADVKIIRTYLRYIILALLLGTLIAWLIIEKPIAFNKMDWVNIKQSLYFDGMPWLLRVFELFILLVVIKITRAAAVKKERREIELRAPESYKKLYLEKNIKIKELENDIDHLRLENKALKRDNKVKAERLGIVYAGNFIAD